MILRNRGIVQCCSRFALVVSKKNRLFISFDNGDSWSTKITIPLSFVAYLKSSTEITSRLFRLKIDYVVWATQDHLVILGYGKIFTVDVKRKCVCSVASVHGKRPLALCASPHGIYYGEYRNNSERSPVQIWGSHNQGVTWESVYQFDDVRHIHGVFYDNYEDKIWITTGDSDSESSIWVTGNNFKNMTKVIGGSQQYRAVSLLFTKKYIFWGSDTPLEQNYIYRMARGNGYIERLQKVDSSIFWGCKVKDTLFFSTAVEPSDVNKCHYACIWGSSDGEKWKLIAQYKKDIWPKKLFQYGQILFPIGENNTDVLRFSPFATAGNMTKQEINLIDLF